MHEKSFDEVHFESFSFEKKKMILTEMILVIIFDSALLC